MKYLILLLIVLLPVLAWGQAELTPENQWYKPDPTKQGRIYYNPENKMKVITGDTLSATVEPTFTLQKWGKLDSPALFRIQQFDGSLDSNRMTGDSLFLFKGDQRQVIYPLADGLEWTILLKKKPVSPVLSFDIVTSNLTFSSMGKVTQWEIDNKAVRPDSLIDAYTFYHKSKSWNDYGTGQAGIIYRPKAWDSNNDTVWCTLNIDTVTGLFSLTLPTTFWNNAIYPVIVDPTFGYTDIGGLSNEVEEKIHGGVTSPDSNGTLDSMAVYLKDQETDHEVKCAVYLVRDSSASPKVTALIDSSLPVSVGSGGDGWYFFVLDINATVFSDSIYAIVVIADSEEGSMKIVFQIGAKYQPWAHEASQAYNDVWENPWEEMSSSAQFDEWPVSIYAFYTTAAPAAAGQVIIIQTE